MRPETELVRRYVQAMREEAKSRGIDEDVVGRLLLQEAIELWKGARTLDDIRNELCFVADSLDPDVDFEFMRP